MGKRRPDQTVLDANIHVHAKIADTYDRTEPHFRAENRQKVRARLEQLCVRHDRSRMLDVGCGSGFVISLTHDLFERVDGIDITEAFMARVDTTPGNIHLHAALAEDLPFDDQSFDMVTGYSVLDHFQDFSAVFEEVFRVLRPGGTAYFDLIPNRAYWAALTAADRAGTDRAAWSEPVKRETAWLRGNDQRVADEFGIDPEQFRLAEPYKARGGIDPEEALETARSLGFSSARAHREWFLGQAGIIHGPDPDHAAIIEQYLAMAHPVSDGLFKYFWLDLRR